MDIRTIWRHNYHLQYIYEEHMKNILVPISMCTQTLQISHSQLYFTLKSNIL
jgi:hypothetical protein